MSWATSPPPYIHQISSTDETDWTPVQEPSLHHCQHIDSTVHPVPRPVGTPLPFYLSKQGRSVDHTFTSSIAVKHKRNITSTPSNMLPWCGTSCPRLPQMATTLTEWVGSLTSRLALGRKYPDPVKIMS
jgi:hypothetical protein